MSPLPVEIVTLNNGFELLLLQDHSAPVVSAQAWCRAGSIHEDSWIGAGLSHVLEHMLFKGTTSRGPGKIDQEIQAVGGYMNAYTSFDRTVYWINTPNSGASVAIDVLCDIFQNATLDADELSRELDVIRREMAMTRDDPSSLSVQRLLALAYSRSPYRYPIIGLPDLFNRIDRSALLHYYQQKYSPNNTFMVLVGDFDRNAVVDQIQKAHQNNPARPLPSLPLIPEPRQLSPREQLDEAPIELAHLHIAWHAPQATHADTPALDVLASILGSGRSSRLHQSIREHAQLAHSVNAWLYAPADVGLLGASAITDAPQALPARDAILKELDRLHSFPVTAAELQKAVKQASTSLAASRKTMEGQARDIGGSWLLARDPAYSHRYLSSVQNLALENIQHVAKTYLQESSRNILALLPEGARASHRATPASRSDSPVQLHRLANGLRVLLKPDLRLPFVQLRLVFPGGSLIESESLGGIGHLAAQLRLKGTAARSAEQIATEIESLAGSIEPYSASNSFGISAEFLEQDLAAGLDLFSDVLLRPTWDPAQLQRERDVLLGEIRGQRDHLLTCAMYAMRRLLFGPQGYGLDPLGSENSVNAIQRTNLEDFHHTHVRPDRGVLAVFGNFQPDTALALLNSSLQSWQSPPSPPPDDTHPATWRPESRRTVESRDKEQSVVVLGFPAVSLFHPDRFALALIQEACSDMGTRLFLRIRDTLGLAYYVGATHFSGRAPGFFAFYCGTAPDKAAQVEEELRAQAQLLANEGLTEEELTRAKAKSLGHRKIARQDLGALALEGALDELYGLGFNHANTADALIEKVTLDDVRRVAAEYFRPEKSCVAIMQGKAG